MSVASLVERVTYKPGWCFHVTEIVPGVSSVELRGKVTSSWRPHDEILVTFETSLHEGLDEKSMLTALLSLVRHAESHETQEWFKLDGVRWPHSDHSRFY